MRWLERRCCVGVKENIKVKKIKELLYKVVVMKKKKVRNEFEKSDEVSGVR